MTELIATVDKQIIIPPHFKNLTGDDEFTIELKAETPEEVPDHIAQYYVKNHPKMFRLNKPIVKTTIEQIAETKNDDEKETFEPLTFIEQNFQNIGEAIKENDLKRPQILELAKILKLTSYGKQTNERVVERIINDIDVKIKHEAKMSGK